MDTNPFYSNEQYLLNVWGEDTNTLKDSLGHQTGSAPHRFWMNFPAHGHLLADTYQRPVVLFSKPGSSLFLPLCYSPTNNSPICILLLDELSHFISFTFDEAELLPYPMLDPWWRHYVREEAQGWEGKVKQHLDFGSEVLYTDEI